MGGCFIDIFIVVTGLHNLMEKMLRSRTETDSLVENGFVIGQSKKMGVSYQNIYSCMYFTVRNDVKKLC